MIFCLLLAVLAAGCESKSKARAEARAAYFAGQQQGMAMQAGTNSVWIVGDVRTPAIPWTDDLTLARAIVAAEYLGPGDPSQIVLRREGRPPYLVSPRQLLSGYDLPLKPGDRIEVRP
jgi:hypothetical protein